LNGTGVRVLISPPDCHYLENLISPPWQGSLTGDH